MKYKTGPDLTGNRLYYIWRGVTGGRRMELKKVVCRPESVLMGEEVRMVWVYYFYGKGNEFNLAVCFYKGKGYLVGANGNYMKGKGGIMGAIDPWTVRHVIVTGLNIWDYNDRKIGRIAYEMYYIILAGRYWKWREYRENQKAYRWVYD